MHRNQSVSSHNFAMIPRADIPRSSFRIQTAHKTTFDAGKLIPIYCDEILPGDTFNLRMTAFARLATPLFPIMDNMYLDSFFFFVPNRLVWNNWQKFMGEQENPGDSTSYVIPTITGNFQPLTMYDYMGIPVGPQIGANTVEINSLPFRAYNLIWNEWFRDENLQDRVVVDKDDGPDAMADYATVLRRGKRHDYFTSALPWPQKGDSVTIPIGTSAPVLTNGLNPKVTFSGSGGDRDFNVKGGGTDPFFIAGGATPGSTQGIAWGSQTGLYADLSAATAATINQLRQSFQIQKLLERDARGGTRYTEIIRSHFGVISPDARLQRPEYLGGGTTAVGISPVVQTGPTGTSGSDTPLGNLAAIGQTVAQGHGFSQSFTEHGYIIGLVCVRADLNYQQGLRKMWSRSTRYDFYFPAFAMLGEQAILSKEIYCDGSADDEDVFGYQERWAEYRYHPTQITGLFRSTATGTIDAWHLAQNFTARPLLDSVFITENPPLDRIIAVGSEANGQQFICDTFFNIRAARPMPIYSVPGLIDHF